MTDVAPFQARHGAHSKLTESLVFAFAIIRGGTSKYIRRTDSATMSRRVLAAGSAVGFASLSFFRTTAVAEDGGLHTLMSKFHERYGVLSRADLVSEHLGHVDWFDVLSSHATMTVGDLLHHGAGLPGHVHLEAFTIEMSQCMAGGSAAFSPEAGTGRTRFDLVAERFLDPLRLADTRPSNTRGLPGLAAGYVAEGDHFGPPPWTTGAEGMLLWFAATEWTGGGLVSTSPDLAAWGQALLTGRAVEAAYLDSLLDAVPISPDFPCGASAVIYANTPRRPVYGHGGFILGDVSSPRHCVAFQIDTDAGIVDDTTILVPALESAFADLAIAMARGSG